MASQPTSEDGSAARLRAAEDALRKVQAQSAALEQLSEELSLSVHVLEAELAGLHQQLTAQRAGRQAQGADMAPEGQPARSTDADGARLVALNMALDGEPREAASRYLEEHFDIPEREGLLDEVYAAARR
jgi:hypothetical protein